MAAPAEAVAQAERLPDAPAASVHAALAIPAFSPGPEIPSGPVTAIRIPTASERAGTPAPLPPPPMAGPGLPLRPPTDGGYPGTDSLHPRAPSDWIADRAPDPRSSSTSGAAAIAARKDPSSEEDVLIGAPLRVGGGLLGNRKLLAIIGGAVVLLVVVIFAATRGGGTKRSEHAATPHAGATPVAVGETPAGSAVEVADETPAPKKVPARPGAAAVAQTGGSTVHPENAAIVPTESGSDSAPVTPTDTGSAAAPPAPVPARPRHPTIGGKKVVLEYDTPTHEAPKPAATPEEDAASVARARNAYAAGNKRLFAGDAAGAVRAYQQALAAYPGYVAGYRGLGLAYAQQGDKAKALQAFRTYLTSVPAAKDVPLIKKRIAALSH